MASRLLASDPLLAFGLIATAVLLAPIVLVGALVLGATPHAWLDARC